MCQTQSIVNLGGVVSPEEKLIMTTDTTLIEKYRPKTLDDVILQEGDRETFNNLMKSVDIPHLLIYGQPGTGKTTTALALCRALFGPRLINSRVLELNASDKRGIGVVRTTIKNIASEAIGGNDPRYPCPPFRVIILDEVDTMTNDAQSALRKIMEDYSSTTRFMLLCNYINYISAPIVSRCAVMQFKPLNHLAMVKRMQYIAKEESIKISNDTLDAIAEMSEGDMRMAITWLQNTRVLRDLGITPTPDAVYEMAGMTRRQKMTKYIEAVKTMQDARTFAKTVELDVLSTSAVLEAICDYVLAASEKPCSDILLQVSITEKRLSEGADTYLQMLAIFSKLISFKRSLDAPPPASSSSSKKKN
jgi:replication factor C subunit 2/4